MWPYSVQNFFYAFGNVVFEAYFLWLPLILIFLFWKLWVYYVRFYYISNARWTLLEIKMPREIYKSPQAMELVLNMLHQTRDGNLKVKYWDGFVRAWFSLEIVSIDGRVRFFVYAQEFFKKLIEHQIYAQYPDVEIMEADDYVKKFFEENETNDWGMFGAEFGLAAPDAYPIKTYIDYGLHNLATKEEQKTDSLTSFIEFFGSIKEGEQIWFQILIRATKTDWKDAGEAIIDQIMKRDVKPKEGEEGKINFGALAISPGERLVAEAVERCVSKLGFDVGIRMIYLAKKEGFNKINIPTLLGIMKQYNSLNLNGFKPIVVPQGYLFLAEKREAFVNKKILNAFRHRSYFYSPYVRKSSVLNTEELATIFHLPGGVAETPTLGRIEAKKSEPPPNLPI